ncbi:MAG: hypothetical protein QMC96_04355 [Methanomicrobiales archaeon]|nr:hypothetical protein [Methanomicrobiales archaeon]
MECPVCGGDCITPAPELLARVPGIFSPCPACRGRVLDKNRPLKDLAFPSPCECGKRFIDGVFAHLYVILVEEGGLPRTAPLRQVGTPLVHPGFPMERPPFLPEDSLVLLSRHVTRASAERMVREVPEIRGVVRCGDFVPGAVDAALEEPPKVHELLAGCDVRANIFPTSVSPAVIYKQQSLMHIEFPRPDNPKIASVTSRLARQMPYLFVDACSGPGTLGIAAALFGVPHVILNDAWYAAAYWTARNVEVNRENLFIDSYRLLADYGAMKENPVGREPVRIAEAEGEQRIEVYQGDLRRLHTVIPHKREMLTVLDLYEKADRSRNDRLLKEWGSRVGGEVFIP